MTEPIASMPEPATSARRAKHAYEVAVPALDAMILWGWLLFAGGLLLIVIGFGAEDAGWLIPFATAVTVVSVSLLVTAWGLTAVKHMIHAHVTGWTPRE